MTARVFQVRESNRFDVTPAEEYGELSVLLKSSDCSPFNPDRFGRGLRDRLDQVEYDPNRDYIILSGDMLDLIFTIGFLKSEYEHVKVLIFNARDNAYFPRVLSDLIRERAAG